jgi:hypothetical protein
MQTEGPSINYLAGAVPGKILDGVSGGIIAL